MIRFIYTAEKKQTIIEHEEEMLKKYSEVVDVYAAAFAQYNCILKVELGWSNFLKKYNTENRLPIENGYECYVCCNIERNGRVICYEAPDGEEVYYEMFLSRLVSSISKSLFRMKAYLYEDSEEIYGIIDEIEPLLEIVPSLPY